MAHVSVTINARQYRMACEDGQESHLIWLAGDLDRRIEQLRAQFGEIGDMRLTMMAALTVADELVEAGKRLRRLEEELAGLQDARVVTTERAQATCQVSRFNCKSPIALLGAVLLGKARHDNISAAPLPALGGHAVEIAHQAIERHVRGASDYP